ncbi:hypothetical protein COCNU_scaffold007932G000020 [Cocos nucifera]|nr:hypothetical protein [Cocos nucifera]
MKEKVVEVMSLQGTLQKEELDSIELKATLALEEEKRKEAKGRAAELEAHEAKSASKVVAWAMEEFKASPKMKDLNITFG